MADQPLPNILWIGLDEQHRQTVGAYGSRNCKTPYIDGLASEGLVFDHAFSPIAASELTDAGRIRENAAREEGSFGVSIAPGQQPMNNS